MSPFELWSTWLLKNMTAYLVLSSQLGAGLLLLFTLLLQGFHLSLQLLFLLLKDSHVFEELIFLSLCFFHLLLVETQKKHSVHVVYRFCSGKEFPSDGAIPQGSWLWW